MKLDLTDLKVQEEGETTCLQCPVTVFVQHGLEPCRDKDDHSLGHVRNAVFLSLDACIGLGNCVRECNESLASSLCHEPEKHPLFQASKRAGYRDPDGNPWETRAMAQKGRITLFNDEEKTRARQMGELSSQHYLKATALDQYRVSASNPFKIKQIRSIALSVIQTILEGADVNYSNDLTSDDVVQARRITWEDNGRRMMVEIGE